MSELSSRGESAQPLPPLRIHHLLALTAVFSCVMAIALSIWRLRRFYAAETTMHEFSTWGMFLGTAQWLALATSLTILLFGRTWRHKRLPFPSQPGHWIAFYLAWRGLFRLAQDLIMMALSHTPTSVIIVGSICTEVLFHVVALGICVAAYRREHIQVWRWGWVAIAVHSALMVTMYTFSALVFLYRLLYSFFWVSSSINWNFPLSLGVSFGYFYQLIVYYAVFASVLLAATFDMRNLRRRHWSHWAVLVTLGIQLSVYIVTIHRFSF